MSDDESIHNFIEGEAELDEEEEDEDEDIPQRRRRDRVDDEESMEDSSEEEEDDDDEEEARKVGLGRKAWILVQMLTRKTDSGRIHRR